MLPQRNVRNSAESKRTKRRTPQRLQRRKPHSMNTVRAILILAIVGVMLFALYTLFLWPTLSSMVHSDDEYVIEDEEREDQQLKLAPISRIRSEDLAEPIANSQRRKNVVEHHIRAQHSIASGVAAEYHVPRVPVVPQGATYPVRNPQPGRIVYGRPGTVWERGAPSKGLHGIDPDHLHGQNNVREDGTPGWTPLPDLDWSAETLEEKKERHKGACFNTRRSDSVALDRSLSDARSPGCPHEHDLRTLPTTSVVFIFYNEPISPLLRSIHSVLDRSPPELLKEIILIDDGSDAEWLGSELESYVHLLPKTILKRIKRSGLMVARTEGALLATAETITFLDSHIEVNHGWLEPLMERISHDRTRIVMPVIDSIDADSLAYRRGGIDILGFTWTLGQAFLSRPKSDVDPMLSPVMAGGLFSIDRLAFYELGTYDQEMRFYGGEEMEFSFRAWQCGYSIECLPCSRVGHIFRSGKFCTGQVFGIPGHEITRNKLRAARAWMGDEYSKIVELASAVLPETNPIGDLSNLLEVKDRLKCRDFDWYMHNVYPELKVPTTHIKAAGALYNPDTFACVDTLGQTVRGSVAGAYPCHWSHGSQAVIYNEMRQISLASTSFSLCLERGRLASDPMVMSTCAVHERQQFDYDLSTGHLKLGAKCMEVQRNDGEQAKVSPWKVFLNQCSFTNARQEWRFKE